MELIQKTLVLILLLITHYWVYLAGGKSAINFVEENYELKEKPKP